MAANMVQCINAKSVHLVAVVPGDVRMPRGGCLGGLFFLFFFRLSKTGEGGGCPTPGALVITLGMVVAGNLVFEGGMARRSARQPRDHLGTIAMLSPGIL